MISDIKKELAALDTAPGALRAFGLLFGGLFALWTGAVYWKGSSLQPWTAGLCLVFLLTGLFIPRALRQPYRLWMLLSFVLGWLMTRFILMVLYFALITPIGFLMRLSGKDLLEERLDKGAQSYWKIHESVSDRKQYEKQF